MLSLLTGKERAYHATIADDQGNIYVIAGRGAGNINLNSCYKFTPSTNQYTQIANITTAIFGIDGVLINGKIYIPGDADNAKLYIYTISSNTWQTLSNVQSNGVTVLKARYFYQVQNIGTKIYLMSGNSLGSSVLDEVWMIDIATYLTTTLAKWTQLASVNVTRAYFGSSVIHDRIYVIGGFLNSPLSSVEYFDPTITSSQWIYDATIDCHWLVWYGKYCSKFTKWYSSYMACWW